MSMSNNITRPARVEVDLSCYTKAQSDLVRMELLLKYGHPRLFLASDGSSVAVEMVGSMRSVDILSLAATVASTAADD